MEGLPSRRESKLALSTERRVRAGQTVTRDAWDWPARPPLASALALVVGAVMLSSGGDARAATYKWVDEKGVVHYSDKMPPEAVDKASSELSKQGVTINKTDKALSLEQRRAKEQEAGRSKENLKAQEEVARRDRALVASYTSEAEIDLARNRSLQTINNVIQSSQAYSEQLTKRKADIEAKKAESQGKSAAAVLDRELESIDTELQRQAGLIAQKNKEAAAITAKYDADKQRWRELSTPRSNEKSTTANEKAAATAKAAVPASSAYPVVPAGTAKK